MAHKVGRAAISANPDWTLSGDRYLVADDKASHFDLVPLGDVVEILDSRRKPITKHDREPGPYPYYGATGVLDYVKDYLFDEPLVLVGEDGAKWGVGDKTAFAISGKTWVNNHAHVLRPKRDVLLDTYLIEMLNEMDLSPYITGVTVPKLNQEKLRSIEIPLPPLAIQQEIVAEIESYQKITTGARLVVENYLPRINVRPDWLLVNLGELIDELESGVSVNSANRIVGDGEIGILKTSCVSSGAFNPLEHKAVLKEEIERVRCPVRANTIIISRMNTEALVGANAFVAEGHPNLYLPDRLWQTVISRTDVEVQYLQTVLASKAYRERISALCGGTSGSMKNISKPQLLSLSIPLPPIETQQAIVAEIEAEQALVNANKQLIERFEAKIKAAINRVWGSAE